MFTDFTEKELLFLIKTKVEENLHLEYKGAGSLVAMDRQKKEISKDISAFANSDGGTIIYGMREFDDKENSHLPEKIDPIDRTIFSKEWIEQVIHSNIQPKIENLTIHPINLSSDNKHVAYVIKIPKSNTVHQAGFKTYHKRNNFKVDIMEDYEIRDVMNRLASPHLNLLLQPDKTTFSANILEFPISLQNQSKHLARDVKVNLEFKDSQNYSCESFNGFMDTSHINPGRKIYSTNIQLPIYNGANNYIGTYRLHLNEGVSKVSITTTIFGDNMFPVVDNFEINIVDDIPTYFLLN